MIITNKYMKIFDTNLLSDTKFTKLKDLAVELNLHKNKVSVEVSKDLGLFMEINPNKFVTFMRTKYYGIVGSNFDSQLYKDIFIKYDNKFKQIQKKLIFKKLTFEGFEFYKRKTKNKQKGDFKLVKIKKESTELSVVLTYLARYGNENIVDYINSQLTLVEPNKQNFYTNILNKINKFGFNRLMNLVNQRKNRIINKYSKPIVFKKLTFGGRSRLTDIIKYNKNYNSKIKTFINLSWLERSTKLYIPVKYSKNWHGSLKSFHKKSNDYEFLIVFNEDKITVNICKSGDRFIPDNKTNFVGIDVNIKHNLFALNDGSAFDYNRQLINDLCKELTKIDKLKANKDYVVGKNRQTKVDLIKNKIKKSNEQLCSDVCKYLNTKGLDHIVMEDLTNGFGRSNVKDKNNHNINFNRTVAALNLSSLKQMMEHVARNYNVSVSTVHPHYTSKACPLCGCIDDGNRTNQETFCCVKCGHKDNADTNAAVNIKNRVVSTVLRNKLLKLNKIGNNSFEPKSLNKDQIKQAVTASFKNF